MRKIEVEKRATLTGHKDCVYALEKGDNESFFSSGGDGMVVVWDLKKPDVGQLVVKVDNSVYSLHFQQERGELLVGENFSGLHKVDLFRKKETSSAAITDSTIFDIKVSDKIIFTGTGKGELILSHIEDLSTIKKIKVAGNSIRKIAVNPVRDEIALGTSENRILIFSIPDMALKKTIAAHDNSVFALEYSPDGMFLYSGSRDAHIKVWETNDYTLKKSVAAHMYAINDLAFRADGKYFATCSMDKSIKIWQSHDVKLLKVIDKGRYAGHGTSVNKLFWSETTGELVSCSDDRTLSIWNINLP